MSRRIVSFSHVESGVELDVQAPRPQPPIEVRPFHESVFPDGTPWVRFFRVGDNYLLRFPELADFVVTADGSRTIVCAAPGVGKQTIEQLYLNQVQPLAWSCQQRLVLHGSAIELGDCAVAFLGVSGRGKSTLAASFATSGHQFLTDDGLLVERAGGAYVVQPSHPSFRLWDDSRAALMSEAVPFATPADYTTKMRLLARGEVRFCGVPCPLRAIYFLGSGDTETVSIEQISMRDAMIELVRHSFLIDIEEREMLAHHFAQLADLVSTAMLFRLDYPRQFKLLAHVRAVVIGHAKGIGAVQAA